MPKWQKWPMPINDTRFYDFNHQSHAHAGWLTAFSGLVTSPQTLKTTHERYIVTLDFPDHQTEVFFVQEMYFHVMKTVGGLNIWMTQTA